MYIHSQNIFNGDHIIYQNMSNKTRKRKSDNDAVKEAANKRIKRTAPAHGVVKIEETQRDELERLLNGNPSNDAPPTPT